MVKSLFIGQFSQGGITAASSAAGDIVQAQIIEEIEKLSITEESQFLCMAPNPCWPRGKIFHKGKKVAAGRFISYLNLPVIKNIVFSLQIFLTILKIKPDIITQYNSYLWENITLLFSRFLFGKKIVCIVQDIRVTGDFSFRAKLNDKLSCSLLKYFNFTIPVSEALARYLKLREESYLVFEGGVTSFGFEAIKVKEYEEEYAVYAGALEKYNGVDRLIKVWNEFSIPLDLHIFGSGRLETEVKELSKHCNNIIYHGLVSQGEVLEWQKKSKYNFCFRYSDGLNQDFFFPSKFFNVSLCPGLLICNDFNGVPEITRNSPGYIGQDINNINKIVKLNSNEIRKSADFIRERIIIDYSWSRILNLVYSRLL